MPLRSRQVAHDTFLLYFFFVDFCLQARALCDALIHLRQEGVAAVSEENTHTHTHTKTYIHTRILSLLLCLLMKSSTTAYGHQIHHHPLVTGNENNAMLFHRATARRLMVPSK